MTASGGRVREGDVSGEPDRLGGAGGFAKAVAEPPHSKVSNGKCGSGALRGLLGRASTKPPTPLRGALPA
jgi:hypothetical protein